jgi:hypothetical protein
MTAKNSKKTVVITAPKITNAWLSLCDTTAKNDLSNIAKIEILANEIAASALSIRDVMKVIKESPAKSSIVKVSHIEGLTTWLHLRKDKQFQALNLDKQLSAAVSAYKLLGVKTAQGLKGFEAVAKATKQARATKNSKGKATPTKKEKATDHQTISAMLTYIIGLDFSKLEISEIDALAELNFTLEAKIEASNEAWASITMNN